MELSDKWNALSRFMRHYDWLAERQRKSESCRDENGPRYLGENAALSQLGT